jgi:lipid A disaccharide synthetase
MREAGVELIAHVSDAFGLIEAVSSLRKLKTALKNADEALRKFKPQVLIPIDYPDFNLKVATIAKSLGVKILYYVSPQVWAWRKGRIKKIAGLVDRMTVILPFEEKIYREAGVECEFVGHPVFEEIEEMLEETVNRDMNFPQAISNPPIPPLEKGGKGGFVLVIIKLHHPFLSRERPFFSSLSLSPFCRSLFLHLIFSESVSYL